MKEQHPTPTRTSSNRAAPTAVQGVSSQPNSRIALLTLCTLGVLAALYVAADLLTPIALAILLSLLLSPIVRVLQRFSVPRALAAGVLVVAIVSGLAAALAALATPAEEWLRQAPTSLRELQEQLTSDSGALADIQELAEEVEGLAGRDSSTAQPVVVKGPGLLENVLGGLPSVLAFAGIVVFLSFFLLASGDTLLRRVTRCGRNWAERRRIVMIARETQSDLSRYLLTVTAINLSLGGLVALIVSVLGVPNPLLWGATAALFNYAPYAGAMATAVLLTLVGLTSFDSLGEAFAVPGSFLVLTILEGQVVTPAVLGQRMALSPVIVFLAVVVWGWLWGIAGALMAVPIVTSLKVMCDHVPALGPFGAILRRDLDTPMPRTADQRRAANIGAAASADDTGRSRTTPTAVSASERHTG